MPKPYSHDLRSRALQACDAGERPGSVVQRFRGSAFIYGSSNGTRKASIIPRRWAAVLSG